MDDKSESTQGYWVSQSREESEMELSLEILPLTAGSQKDFLLCKKEVNLGHGNS